jgi:hypothetical protein
MLLPIEKTHRKSLEWVWRGEGVMQLQSIFPAVPFLV